MGGQSPNTHLDSAVSSGCQHSPPLVPGELPCSAECWPKVQQTNTNPLTQGIWTPRRTYWKFEKEMLLMYLPHIHQWPAWASSLPSLSSSLYLHPFKSSLLNTAQTTLPLLCFHFLCKATYLFLMVHSTSWHHCFQGFPSDPSDTSKLFSKKKKKVPSHGLSGIAVRITLLLLFINWVFCCCYRSVARSCPLSTTPQAIARQAPPSLGFPVQECWSGLAFPSSGDLPNAGIKPMAPASLALQADSLPLSHKRSPFRKTCYVEISAHFKEGSFWGFCYSLFC